ncbi:UNVERIFIED_CONTAM: hypothetical protein K2H54_053082 [Gekko kuhli]
MVTMSHFEPFNPKVVNWESYLDHFECCLIANDIEEDDVRHATLLSTCGQEKCSLQLFDFQRNRVPVIGITPVQVSELLPAQGIVVSSMQVERAPCRLDFGTVQDLDRAEDPPGHCDYGHSQVRPNEALPV